MPHQRIRATGQPALVFEGELLHALDNRRGPAVERQHWHEIALYRVDKPQNFQCPAGLLVKVAYLSTRGDERPHEWVGMPAAPVPQDFTELMKTYDPLTPVSGYPAGERYAESQRLLLEQIASDWRALVAAMEHWLRLASTVD